MIALLLAAVFSLESYVLASCAAFKLSQCELAWIYLCYHVLKYQASPSYADRVRSSWLA